MAAIATAADWGVQAYEYLALASQLHAGSFTHTVYTLAPAARYPHPSRFVAFCVKQELDKKNCWVGTVLCIDVICWPGFA